MKLWNTLFEKSPGPEKRRSTRSAEPGRRNGQLLNELVRTALRDTLIRHGIPRDWVSAEVQWAGEAQGGLYFNVQFSLAHWESRFVQHTLAFQRSFMKRLALLDATQRSRLQAITWQFLEEGFVPEMPPPGTWSAAPPLAAPPIIPESPQHTPKPNGSTGHGLDELRRMLVEEDARRSEVDFQNTQPMDRAWAQQQVGVLE
jgi:hypothetical protein